MDSYFDKSAENSGIGVFFETDSGKYIANLNFEGKVLSKYNLASKIGNSPTEHQVAVKSGTDLVMYIIN
jgi:hypothetical protein